MQVKFNFTNQHHCQAGVMHCEDFRFWQAIGLYLRGELHLDNYDLISLAGGGKNILNCDLNNPEDIVTKSINVSFDLHQADTLVIINHRDCGAYGGSQVFNHDRDKERDFHLDQLSQARVKLIDRYPDKKIIVVYVDLDNEQKLLELSSID
ncbi:MAG: carbonic anhydrase [bacterium]